MRFIDEVKIKILSGNGGSGCVGFRREKYVPLGGPDGGDGGRGGHVFLRANQNLNTLVHFRGKKIFQAEDGGAGSSSESHGKNGEDLYIDVPVGTQVYDVTEADEADEITNKANEVLICDLKPTDFVRAEMADEEMRTLNHQLIRPHRRPDLENLASALILGWSSNFLLILR